MRPPAALADSDHAIDKLPIYIKVLPRPLQKFILRYCTAPVLLFFGILFFLVILPLSIQDYIQEASRGLNNMFVKDPRYKYIIAEKPLNRWLELTLQFRQEVLTSYTPYVSDPESGCIDRERYRFEFVRLLGLNPYKDNLSRPHVLVIGDKTQIGTEIINQLNESGVPVAHVGCQNSIDFASDDAQTLFADLSVSDAIVTCPMVYPRYSHSDGLSYVRKIHSNYLRGIGRAMSNRQIPWTLVVEEPLEKEHGDIAREFGGRVIMTSPMATLPWRAAKECAKVGKSTVELKGYEMYSEITPSDVAVFVVQNLKNKDYGNSIHLVGEKEFKMRDVFEKWPDSRCVVTVKPLPHRSEPYKPENVVSLHGNGGQFGKEEVERARVENVHRDHPYLSFVVVGRHDNFSNGFENRLQNFINSLGRGLERIPLADIELVVVDYATPEDRTPLHDTVTIPMELKGKTRFIRVPVARHERLQARLKSDLEFFEYIAKNIGIRRANGDFILSTNPDNIFPSTLFELIAAEDFNRGVLYRSVRWDTRDNTFKNATVEDLWQAVGEPWRLKQFDVKQRCSTGDSRFIVNDKLDKFTKQAYPCAAGDFLMASRELWSSVWGFTEIPANPNVDAVLIAKFMRLIPGYARFFIYPPNLHQKHDKVNVFRTSVENHETAIEEYACWGESKQLKKFDTHKWGLVGEDFDEVLL